MGTVMPRSDNVDDTVHLIIEPNRGANDLTFGRSRQGIRELLGALPLKTRASEPENVFYTIDGLILGYDAEDGLEFIEVIPPSSADFDGIPFFAMGLPQVLAELHNRGFIAPFQRGCYNFTEPGLALYCPDQELRSVSIYRRGYYDRA